MNIKYKLYVIFLFFGFSFQLNASCQIKPTELQFYLTSLMPHSGLAHTNVLLGADHAIIKRPLSNDIKINNLSFNNLDIHSTKRMHADKEYTAIIIPPATSSKAIRYDLPKKKLPVPTSFEQQIRRDMSAPYSSASLGDKGALALFQLSDIKGCKSSPSVLYIIPENAKGVDKEIIQQALIMSALSFNQLILAIMQANSDYQVRGKTLPLQLNHDTKNSNVTNRSRMFRSTVILNLSDTLRKQANIQLTRYQSKNILSLPLWSDWHNNIERSIQPPSIMRLRGIIPDLSISIHNYSQLRDIIKQNKQTNIQLKNFLDESGRVLIQGTAFYADAKNYLDKNMTSLDPNRAQTAAGMSREIIGFSGSLAQIRNQYEEIYGVFNKAPQIKIAGGFDAASILSVNLDLPDDACNLPAQSITGPIVSTTISGKTLNINTNFYVYYKKFFDPIYNIDLIRPHFIMSGDVSQIHSIHQSILSKKIPRSDCRHRYSQPTAPKTYADHSWIKGQSTIHYEKWICEDYKFICWDWGPKTCRKYIKKKVYGGNQVNNFTVSSSVWDQSKLKILLRSTFDNNDSYIPFGSSEGLSFLKTTAGLKWESSRFDFMKGNSSKLLLAVKGKGKAMRINTACSLHNEIKSQTFK